MTGQILLINGTGTDAGVRNVAAYYRLSDLKKTKGNLSEKAALCAPSGARTLDPNIKSVVLYQLS